MQNFLLGILFFILLVPAKAQISFSPNPVEVSANPNETENIQADFELKNEGDDTFELAWTLKVLSQPNEWEYYVCDTEICYNFNQNESSHDKPNILNPDTSIVIMFHTIPSQIEGIGEYVISFFDVDNPDNILVEVPVSVNTVTTSTQDVITKGLNVFPNPTTDYFRINTGDIIKKIDIHSVIGKKVTSFKAAQGKYYDVSDLLIGMYYVRLLDEKDNVLKVVKLKKN